MDEKLAEQFASETGGDLQSITDRWKGAPEVVAEDLFQSKNFDTGEMEPLELFHPYQPQILHAYFYGDSSILNIYKGRRIGVSFIIVLAMLIDGLSHKEMFFPIVSRRKEQSQSRVNDIRTLINNAKIDIPVRKDIKNEIVLENGSRFKAYTANPEGARGDDSARTVFVDEMAFLEDQEETMQAFMPFISLGTQGQMVQVSTPKVSNDTFMETHRRGNQYGKNGVISLKQPTFKRADQIDIEKPLYEQNVQPVRPDLNIEAVESERAQDPQGFAQEYLCRPISDEYRFFSTDAVERAQKRGSEGDYAYGAFTGTQYNGTMVAGIDLGASGDDTVISVFEHYKRSRYLRYHEVVNQNALELSGISNPDRGNPNHLLKRFRDIKDQMGIDHFVIDSTGMGKFFDSNLTDILGRSVHKFDFNDKEAVLQMAGDLNAALREDMVTLYPDEDMRDQMTSMVKEQKEDWQTPKLSGKDHSKDGKDDIAMSLILGGYPVMLDTSRSTSLRSADKTSAKSAEGVADSTTGASRGATGGSRSGSGGSKRTGSSYSSTRASRGSTSRRSTSTTRNREQYKSRRSRRKY